jgi:hypothetical protein
MGSVFVLITPNIITLEKRYVKVIFKELAAMFMMLLKMSILYIFLLGMESIAVDSKKILLIN